MKHSDQIALDDQRYSEQRGDPLLTQNRIEDVGVVHVGDEDRDALGRNPAGEALADRNPHALLDLFFDSLRGACDELSRRGVVQQDRDGVDLERLLDADQQLVEKLFERKLGQSRIAQPVRASPFVCALGAGLGGHHYDLARARARPSMPLGVRAGHAGKCA